MSGIDLFSPFIMRQLQEDPALLDMLAGGGVPPDAPSGPDPLSVFLGAQRVPPETLAESLGFDLLGRSTPYTRAQEQRMALAPPDYTPPPLPTVEPIPPPPPMAPPVPSGPPVAPAQGTPGNPIPLVPPAPPAPTEPAPAPSDVPSAPTDTTPIPPPVPPPNIVPPVRPPAPSTGAPTAAAIPAAAAAPSGSFPPIPAVSSAGGNFNTNALLQYLMADMLRRNQFDPYDAALRFGAATMEAAGKPMSTTLGSIGTGLQAAIKGVDERQEAGLKHLTQGAQIANLMSEVQQRQDKSSMVSLAGALAARDYNAPISTVNDPNAKPPAGVTPLSTNQVIIADELRKGGLNNLQLAGALGWATGESGPNANTAAEGPMVVRNGKELGKAAYWQQWFQDRRDNIEKFAAEQGLPPTDPRLNARFFLAEMKGQVAGAGELAQRLFWSAQTPEEITRAMAHYSRTNDYKIDSPQSSKGYADRLAATRRILGGMSAPQVAGTGGTNPAEAVPSSGGGIPPTLDAAAAGGEGGVTVESGAVVKPSPAPPAVVEAANAAGLPSPTLPNGLGNPAYARMRGYILSQAGDTAGASHWYKQAEAKEGWVWMPDGSQARIRGGPADLSEIEREARAKKAGESAADWPYQWTLQQEKDRAEREKVIAVQRLRDAAELDRLVKGKIMDEEIEARKPKKQGPTDVETYPADSITATMARRRSAMGEPLPEGYTLNKNGSLTITGLVSQTFRQQYQQKYADDMVKRGTAARAAADQLFNIEVAMDLLKRDPIFGTAADARYGFAKLLATLGISVKAGEEVAATGQFLSNAIAQSTAILHAFGSGSGITDIDLRRAMQEVGGDTSMTAKTIAGILQQNALGVRRAVAQYNSDLRAVGVSPNDPGMKQIDIPPPGQWFTRDNAPVGFLHHKDDGTVDQKQPDGTWAPYRPGR